MRCATCDKDFTPKHARRRFCSAACRAVGWRAERVTVERRQLVEIRRMLQALLEESVEAKAEVERILGG